TIVRDAPVTLDLGAAHALDYDPDRVLQLFRELEFHSLVDRLPRRSEATSSAGASESAATEVTLQPDEGLSPGEGDVQLSLFAESELQTIVEQGDEVPPPLARVAPSRPPLIAPVASISTQIIDTEEGLSVLAHSLAHASICSFDLETDSTDEMHANIVGLSFSMAPGEAFYIPVGHRTAPDGTEPGPQPPLPLVLDALRPALTSPIPGKVGHNAKYDMMVLARHGLWVEGLNFDTMVGSYLLNPGRRNLGLKEQAF